MTNENEIALSVLAAFGVVLPLAVGLSLGWPSWVCVLLVLAFLALPVFAHRKILERAAQRELREELTRRGAPRVEEQAAPPQPYASHAVRKDLPSALSDVPFLFSATIRWRVGSEPVGVRHHNPQALAVDLVLTRAREVAAAESPESRELVQDRLNSLLGFEVSDRSGQVEACATEVVLDLSEDDRRRLTELAELRKEEQRWMRTCALERNKREYLGGDALKDTGSALVWWLVQSDLNAGDVKGAVNLTGTLAELSATVNNIEIPERFRRCLGGEDRVSPAQMPLFAAEDGSAAESALLHKGPFYDGATQGSALVAGTTATEHVAGLLDELGFEAASAERASFAGRLAGIVEKSGNVATAEEIRRRFGSSASEGRSAIDIDTTNLVSPISESPASGSGENDSGGSAAASKADSPQVVRRRRTDVPRQRSEPHDDARRLDDEGG